MGQKEGGVEITSKHNKYLTQSILYSMHESKPNLGCKFDVHKQILTKMKMSS
jgi:hypothetical protein